MAKLQRGANYPAVSDGDVKSQELLLPPIKEQERILKTLDEAFEKIAKAKENTEKNLQNAKNIFESYLQSIFVQFDCSTILSDVAKVIGGFSFKSGDFKKDGKYQVLRMGNVRPGVIREKENPVFINDVDPVILKRTLLQMNDVIITQTGTKNKRDYGYTAVITDENYLLNQRISAIRFSSNYLPRFFLYYSWTNLFKDQYFANEKTRLTFRTNKET
jgi:type I restriction enzyme S subunit